MVRVHAVIMPPRCASRLRGESKEATMPLARPLALALTLAAATPAAAQAVMEFPQRRTGHWEIRMTLQGPNPMPEQIVQTCIDGNTDRQMMQAGLAMSRDMCQRYDMRREGADFVIEAACQMGPMRTTSRTIISGDFNASYTVRTTGTVEGMPGVQGRQDTAMTHTARWVAAACPAGMSPGDMVMPGGMRMNVRDLERMRPPAPRG